MQKEIGVISKKYVWLGIIGALLIIYPNLICIPWHIERCEVQAHFALFSVWHVIRFLYFAVLIMVVHRLNALKGWTTSQRIAVSISISVMAYALFAYTSHSLLEYGVRDKVGSVLILQFVVICGLGMLTGHISILRRDLTNTITMILSDGIVANVQSSASCVGDNIGVIAGTEGNIIIDNVNNPQAITVNGPDRTFVETIRVPRQITGYEYQFLACREALQEGLLEPREMPHAEVLYIMQLMDDLRQKWGVRYPMD